MARQLCEMLGLNYETATRAQVMDKARQVQDDLQAKGKLAELDMLHKNWVRAGFRLDSIKKEAREEKIAQAQKNDAAKNMILFAPSPSPAPKKPENSLSEQALEEERDEKEYQRTKPVEFADAAAATAATGATFKEMDELELAKALAENPALREMYRKALEIGGDIGNGVAVKVGNFGDKMALEVTGTAEEIKEFMKDMAKTGYSLIPLPMTPKPAAKLEEPEPAPSARSPFALPDTRATPKPPVA